jgi:hypothetical protein
MENQSSETKLRNLAAGFRPNAEFDRLLKEANGNRAKLNALPAQQRLALGHYLHAKEAAAHVARLDQARAARAEV